MNGQFRSLKVVGSAILVGCSLLLGGCTQQGNTAPPANVPTVTVAKPVKKQIVEWDEYTGRLEAVDFVEVRARVSGYLQSIHFSEGEIVKQGALLFVIDPRPFEAELKGAQAVVVQSESQLAQAKAQHAEAKARHQQSLAQLTLAETRVQRIRSLKERIVVTQEELDQAEAQFLQAQADVEATVAGISSAEAAVATASAGIESARAQVETAQLNLEYSQIYAPVAGRISRQFVTEGNLISGGAATSTLLTTITSVDPIYCTFDANEQEVLKYIRLQQSGASDNFREAKNPVYLGLIDEPAFPRVGHMDFVDNRFDADTASLRVRSVFPNYDQVLVPGMFARLRIPGSPVYEAVLIPDSAVGTDQSSRFVYVVADETVERRPVTLGPIVDGLRVIREGLTGDETIIIEGLLRARPQMKIQSEEGAIRVADDGLPDSFQPLPPEKWISRRPDPPPQSAATGRVRSVDSREGSE